MTSKDVSLKAVVAELHARGIDLDDLAKTATQVVLFGSWAVGLQRPDSDIDLLCVGIGTRMKTGKVDIVWISPEFSKSSQWRRSELANHIIKYGKWLIGSNGWGSDIRISKEAIQFKRTLIRSRSTELYRRWNQLSADYRLKHVVKLRRDIQRLAIMRSGDAVPASPGLDEEWAEALGIRQSFEELLRSLGEDGLVDPSLFPLIEPFRETREWREKPETPPHTSHTFQP
jgi:predicted nucleotidyltransferase